MPNDSRSRSRARRAFCILPTLLAFAAPRAFAGEEAKLVAPNPGNDDRFGSAVAIDASTAVVGAPRHAEGGIDSGAAFVYVASGSSWNLQAVLLPNDPATGQWFGGAVAIDGDAIVVGARHDPQAGFNAGAAYVFRRSGTSWTQEMKLLANNSIDFDWLGNSVSIDGDRVCVGAPFKNVVSFASGAAFVFVRNAGVWTQEFQLAPNDPGGNDFFGWAVSLSGDRAAVGSKFEDQGAMDAGSAYVFLRSGSNWTQEAKLFASDAAVDDEFATALALDGSTLVVGSLLDDDLGSDSGSAYVFTRSGSSWSQTAKLTATDGVAGDLFGNAVAVRGSALVVGSYHPDDLGTHTGAAYLFAYEGASWIASTRLVGSDSVVDDWFGSDVSISSERVLAGAMQHAGEGAAYVFQYGAPFLSYCFGDGSGTACPCFNTGGTGQGCANSSGMGATLAASGSSSVAADDLVFDAAHLRPGQPALLFAGNNAVNGGAGVVFGDGLRCAGGGVVRLGIKTPNSLGAAHWGPGLGAIGGWGAGATRYFQCWYRDPVGSPCGSHFNLSHGTGITFGS